MNDQLDRIHSERREQRILVRTIALSVVVSILVVLVSVSVLYGTRERWCEGCFVGVEQEERSVGSPATVLDSEQHIIDLVERVNPAVVSVVVTKDVPVFENYFEDYNPFGGFFGDDFIFRVPQQRQRGTEEREVGGGSGFFVSNDGLVVTNRHVVSDADANYSILTNDGESYEVEVLARDSVLDIAVLRVVAPPQAGFVYVPFGDSNTLKQGQTVIAIGNALAEFRNSVSVGVISGLSRSIVAGDGRGMSEQLDEVIQTDAAINPGNSGGPLLNSSGEVIGVNVAVAFGSENIGFALPSSVVADIVASVEEFGEIVRPFLGVRYVEVTEALAEAEELSVDYGALIIRGQTAMDMAVMPGSPADRAGLKVGDVIVAIAGESLKERSLASIIRTQKVGDTVELVYNRDGKETTVSVTLDKAPE